ncbi:hypothetical protein BGZ72_002337, partial [Mortierella alpina]
VRYTKVNERPVGNKDAPAREFEAAAGVDNGFYGALCLLDFGYDLMNDERADSATT